MPHSLPTDAAQCLPGLLGVARALSFAADKHRNQRRKDQQASPYINHPIDLLKVLVEAGVDDVVVLQAAILHDTIEDTQTTREELAAWFDEDVASVVMEVTDDKRLPKAERKRLQIAHAHAITHKAKLVKLADKICNLRDMAKSPPIIWDMKRIQEYFDWSLAVVDGLRGTHPGLEALFDSAMRARPEGSWDGVELYVPCLRDHDKGTISRPVGPAMSHVEAVQFLKTKHSAAWSSANAAPVERDDPVLAHHFSRA